MKRQLHIHPHLTLITIACLALAMATAYFLMVIPHRLVQSDPDWLVIGVSWMTAFFAQIGVFLAVVCSVVAHALSVRWSWSVRVFVAVSAYWSISMAMLALNAYEDTVRVSGYITTPAELLERAMILTAIFLFYILFATCTFVGIATRGKRFRFA